MGRLIMVTGGGRSGKSTFAENLLKDKGRTVYIATAIPFDDEMKHRVKIHRERRPADWVTVEKYKRFDKLDHSIFDGMHSILLDCVTVMISNIILDSGAQFEDMSVDEYKKIEESVIHEIKRLLEIRDWFDGTMVIVTNEVGLGIIPDNKLSRYYRETAGVVNAMIASAADEVYLVVAGIPVKIKGA